MREGSVQQRAQWLTLVARCGGHPRAGTRRARGTAPTAGSMPPPVAVGPDRGFLAPLGRTVRGCMSGLRIRAPARGRASHHRSGGGRGGASQTSYAEWYHRDGTHSSRIAGYGGTGDLRFVVYRNYSYGDYTWSIDTVRPSDGAVARWFNLANINTPMYDIDYMFETARDGNYMWGTRSDHARMWNWTYRDTNRNWHAASPVCADNSAVDHHHLDCNYSSTSGRLESIEVWDDRRQ